MKRILIIILAALAITGCNNSSGFRKDRDGDTGLRLFSIVPSTGESGSSAIISGINFTEAVVVKLGDAVAEKVSVTKNRIHIILPENEPGTYPLSLIKGEETAGGSDYTYVEDGKARMTLVNIVPKSGYPGTETVIYGQGFGDDSSDIQVLFDDARGQVTFSTRNIIHVKAPEHAEGDAFVTVRNSAQQAGTLRFTYRRDPVFQLLDISPSVGKAGSTAVITGELFSPVPEENIVTINGQRATVTEATSEKLTIILPPNPEGTYSIHLRVGDKEIEGLSFTYLPRSWIINYFAGNAVNAVNEGTGTNASVSCVQDINMGPDGKLWLTCRPRSTIMTLDLETREAKILVTDTQILNNCWQGEFNSQGVYYVAAKAVNKLASVTRDGVATVYDITDADGNMFTPSGPMDLCFDGDDLMYVACRDLKATPDSPEAGSILKVVNGKVQEIFEAANIGTITLGPDKKLYWGRDAQKANADVMYIYRTDPASGITEKVAGNGTVANATTFTNGEAGKPLTATVNVIRDIFFLSDGAMLFTEQGTGTLRKLTPEGNDYTRGTITTIAGTAWVTSATAAGSYDGAYGMNASLSMYVYGIWAPEDISAIYFADGFNYRVNKLVLED